MARRTRRSFARSSRRSSSRSSGGKFKPLLDAAIGGAVVGAALKVAPAKYNTPLTRVAVGGLAAYSGSGYIKESGKILLGLEAARMTGNAMSGVMSGDSGSSGSSGSYL